jgi:hypothetical protein
MSERIFNPNSSTCGEWETLLAEALDGLLKPADEATFSAHMALCPACEALFEEARRGSEWLAFLAHEPEIPSGLVDRILAQTGPGQLAGYRLATGDGNVIPMPPAWQRPGFMGSVRRFAEPRLMMTAAMAFFSIAMTLNLTGVRLSGLRVSNLKPAAVRSYMERQFTMASTPIIRYYDHSRLVYEVQTRMRELRQTTEGVSQGVGEENRRKQRDFAPGESKQAPARKDVGPRIDPPQQSTSPTLNDSEYMETSLTIQQQPAHSGGSRKEVRERSTVWTA